MHDRPPPPGDGPAPSGEVGISPPDAAPTAGPTQVGEPSAGPAVDGAAPPFVVGIGASAGGLKALVEFFARAPTDAEIGWVVVTHQHAGQASLLPELIANHTSLAVVRVEDGVTVAAGHIYLPPPGSTLGISSGCLHVLDPNPSGAQGRAVDAFFRSLAQDQGHRAIGVVLSGTGSDGTAGIKAIKRAGGLTLAQSERSAGYPGMPGSATATGLVDLVLPPEEMPARIAAHVDEARRRPAPYVDELADPDLEKVLLLLRHRTGYDFSLYKVSTLRRRLERRIQLHQLGGIHQYLLLLRERPEELDELFHEVLIGVTSFFRDPAAFDALGAAASALIQEAPAGHRLRVWVPGCCTGEEAYSLAMLLTEAREEAQVPPEGLQVFATDINPRSVEVARRGRYPTSIESDVAPERLERWFERDGDHYQVVKSIRERVIFAVQNVHGDPPFTRLDLLSCRNLLIYLQPQLQARLLPTFHYALKPGGILFLGSSETIHAFESLFEPLDKRWKVFRRRPEAPATLPNLRTRSVARPPLPRSAPREEAAASIGDVADALLLEMLTPASLFVDPDGSLVHSRGEIGAFLEPTQGRPSFNVISMAREGLGPDLAAAIRKVTASGSDQRRVVRVKTGSDWSLVELEVVPLGRHGLGGLLLVRLEVLEPAHPAEAIEEEGAPPGKHELRLQLTQARSSLQTTVEELETSNEELKSTNEELQSSNEELQSSNEELETSREELQSLNEELQMVNVELAEKMTELSRANDDMTNLLNSTDVATLFLDGRLRIKRFTPQVQQLFQLRDSDIGRPITDLTTHLCYDDFQADAEQVLRSLVPLELQVPSEGGTYYLTRLSPYRTADNRLDGLVVTFVDTTPIRGTRLFTERLLDHVPHPLAVLDDACSVVLTNLAFREFFALPTRAQGISLEQALPALGKELRQALERLKPDERLEPCSVTSEVPGGERRTFRVEGQRVAGGNQGQYVLTIAASQPPEDEA